MGHPETKHEQWDQWQNSTLAEKASEINGHAVAQHPSTVWFDDLIAVQGPKQRRRETRAPTKSDFTGCPKIVSDQTPTAKKALEWLSEAKIQYSSIWGNGCLRPPADLRGKTGQVVYCGKASVLKGAGIDVTLRVPSLYASSTLPTIAKHNEALLSERTELIFPVSRRTGKLWREGLSVATQTRGVSEDMCEAFFSGRQMWSLQWGR